MNIHRLKLLVEEAEKYGATSVDVDNRDLDFYHPDFEFPICWIDFQLDALIKRDKEQWK